MNSLTEEMTKKNYNGSYKIEKKDRYVKLIQLMPDSWKKKHFKKRKYHRVNL